MKYGRYAFFLSNAPPTVYHLINTGGRMEEAMSRSSPREASIFGSAFRVKNVGTDDGPVDLRRVRRLAPSDREKRIAAAAVTFFSAQGFEGQTRELAATLGITQPLLYRYFPSKEALIERVYQEVFVGRWDPFWEEMVVDRKTALEVRLTQFYISYAKVILTPEWVRLFTFAGLKGLDFNGRYLRMLRERIFERIIGELRYEFGRPLLTAVPLNDIEIEMIWGLHASIFYLGVRQFIYGMPLASPVDKIIAAKVKTFLHGVPQTLPPIE
jgi:AcrR family transcriptional regulator